jgi:hypothetical protein
MDAALSQFGVNKGIKLFGQDGVDAVLKELSQLHNRKVVIPEDPKQLTREQKHKALQYLMFLKRK